MKTIGITDTSARKLDILRNKGKDDEGVPLPYSRVVAKIIKDYERKYGDIIKKSKSEKMK